jgi:hypothetical protein
MVAAALGAGAATTGAGAGVGATAATCGALGTGGILGSLSALGVGAVATATLGSEAVGADAPSGSGTRTPTIGRTGEAGGLAGADAVRVGTLASTGVLGAWCWSDSTKNAAEASNAEPLKLSTAMLVVRRYQSGFAGGVVRAAGASAAIRSATAALIGVTVAPLPASFG